MTIELISVRARRPSLLAFAADLLIVSEPNPLGSELLAQHAILLLQIVDDVALLLMGPASDGHEKEPQGV